MHRALVALALMSSFAFAAGNKRPAKSPTVETPTPVTEPPSPATPAPAAVMPAQPVVAPEPNAPPPALPESALPSLVVLTLQATGGIDASLAAALSETLTVEVGRLKFFKVVSQKDLETMLGVERQRQLLGCSEEATSCVSELADAMGARFVMSGSLAKLGDSAFQLNLQTIDSRGAKSIGRSTRIATSLDALRSQLPFAVAEATATPAPRRPSAAPAVVMMAAGGAGVVVGGVLWLQSLTRETAALSELALAKQQPNLVLAPADHYRDEAKAVTELRIAGSIAAGVGAALLVAGVLVLPGDNDVVRVAVVPTGSGVAFAGVFP
jgi:TolB-like protein